MPRFETETFRTDSEAPEEMDTPFQGAQSLEVEPAETPAVDLFGKDEN